jgi:hypothetical protein
MKLVGECPSKATKDTLFVILACGNPVLKLNEKFINP